ncbi:MAG: DUF302 domain-containing protein [Verrucomicrobiota bacterium]
MQTPQSNHDAFPSKRKRIIHRIASLTVALIATGTSADENGLLKKQSQYGVEETAERFEAAVREKGIKVFPRFDHAAAAKEYGLSLPPMVVLPFGNPKYGTALMSRAPSAGIDFPPKAMVYEDENGAVWLAYNSSSYLYEVIFRRHGLEYSAEDIAFYAELLEELTDQAVK